MREIHYLEKYLDELVKGKTMGKMLRHVVLLIAPYLLFGENQYIPALICILLMVVLIITGFTYYTSVAQNQAFKYRFLEMALISVGVAVVSFVVGIRQRSSLEWKCKSTENSINQSKPLVN